MDNFIVSARKYRPATFDTVVGQKSITTTLKNAIKNQHLAQAFLFCGPRGVGKTTCARILAKTINCFNITEHTEACDECESCKAFNSGHSLNVYELDAASNNSVEDIRNLVEQVRFAPQLGSHKIYIIDEVHMLSQAAFNAFLKTLEEPPKHAIFILATTEKHKIIPTILSRCQIFDFNRIQVDDIASHLANIAEKEGIMAEPDALHIIAQKADGALRDALSIFDQIVSFAGNAISYKAVIDNLNVLDYDYYFKLTDALLGQDITNSLLIFNEIINNGFDGHHFISGLGEHFRNLLVCKDEATIELLEVGANIKDKYRDQATRCGIEFLIKGLNIINKCDVQYKISKNQRLAVELALMQLCAINMFDEKETKTGIKMPEKKPAPPAPSASVKKEQQKAQAAPPKQTVTTENKVTTPAKEEPIKKAEPKASTPPPAPKPKQEAPEKPTTEKPQRKAKSHTPSIAEFTAEQQAEQAENETEQKEGTSLFEQAREPFTGEALQTAWSKYATQVKEKGQTNLYSTLTSHQPAISDENKEVIDFTVENKVQEELIEEKKTDLLGVVRGTLNNYHVQLKITINKDETERKPYTPREKFERMAEKNPNINKLKQQFGLDLDY